METGNCATRDFEKIGPRCALRNERHYRLAQTDYEEQSSAARYEGACVLCLSGAPSTNVNAATRIAVRPINSPLARVNQSIILPIREPRYSTIQNTAFASGVDRQAAQPIRSGSGRWQISLAGNLTLAN
jgi:hypothetical protein